MPIGGDASGRVCACSLRCRLVFRWLPVIIAVKGAHVSKLPLFRLAGCGLGGVTGALSVLGGEEGSPGYTLSDTAG